MPGLLPDVDPDGLLEYSVVFTDRSLNHMSQAFQHVMREIHATLCEVYGAHRAVVVTQYFHVARATLACRRAGIDIVGASVPRWFEPRDLYSLAREVVALPVYAVRGR